MFGSSKKHDNETRATDIDNVFGATDDRRHAQPTGAGTGNVNTLGQTQGGGTGTNYNNDKALPSEGLEQPFAQNQNDQYATGGVGSGRPDGPRGIPPTSAIDHNRTDQTNSQGGAGGRLGGKIESTIGSIVGSDALKAQGLQKENEANTFKLQSRELAEAERLENEALKRRESAVAHGANPANSALGAGNPAVGSGHRQL